MNRPGPGFPKWAFAGFSLGATCGGVLGYFLAQGPQGPYDRLGLILGSFLAGGCAAGGAVVGGVRDILAYLHHRFPPTDGPEADYRDRPMEGLPPAPPLVR